MRVLFGILSIAYIVGIFFFADSSMVSDLSSFNPYSILHIPLYGILTVLLIFSFVPATRLRSKPINPMNPINSMNPTNQNNSIAQLPNNLITPFLIVGLISSMVAITDEIHQVYVPGRDASVTDVLLDFTGIILAIFSVTQYCGKKRTTISNNSITQ